MFCNSRVRAVVVEPKERILKVSNYSNTDFVNFVMERRFYARLDENAEKLGIKPEAIISNVFFLALGKLEQMVTQKGSIARCLVPILCVEVGW